MIHEWVIGMCRGGFALALGSGKKLGVRIGRHDRRWSEASGGMRLVLGVEMVDGEVVVGSRACSPWPRGSCRVGCEYVRICHDGCLYESGSD